ASGTSAAPCWRRGSMPDDARLRALYALRPAISEHPSEADWERLLCGELGDDERERVQAHVVRCAECVRGQKALEEVSRQARAFDPDVPRPHPRTGASLRFPRIATPPRGAIVAPS